MRLSRTPQFKIMKNIGINRLSKNKQNKKRSKAVKVNNNKNSVIVK